MNKSILKITETTPQLEMEIADLLEETAVRRSCTANQDLFAIFDADGRLLGLACAEWLGEECLIYFVVVRLESRMRGAGSALVNHVLGYYAGRCGRAFAAAYDAGAFFERFGFDRVTESTLPEAVSIALSALEPRGSETGGATARQVMILELPSRWTIP